MRQKLHWSWCTMENICSMHPLIFIFNPFINKVHWISQVADMIQHGMTLQNDLFNYSSTRIFLFQKIFQRPTPIGGQCLHLPNKLTIWLIWGAMASMWNFSNKYNYIVKTKSRTTCNCKPIENQEKAIFPPCDVKRKFTSSCTKNEGVASVKYMIKIDDKNQDCYRVYKH